MNSPDPKILTLPNANKVIDRTKNQSGRLPNYFPGQPYLKGPIPWEWLCAAGQLPGKAMHVAIGIWHLAGMKKKMTIKFSSKKITEIGVNRYAMYRALTELEKNNLISVERHCGRNSTVTILFDQLDKK